MKGNVGIGTDNPENGLHVSDGSSYAAPQNTGAGKVMIEHASSADLQFMTANSGYNHIFFGDQDDANIGSIVYHHASNANAMVFNTNTAEALRITSTGLLQATSGQHDGGLHLLSGNNNQSTSLRLQAKSSGGTSYDWYLDSARSTDRFSISDGTTSWLTILGDGKVGINTVIPGTEFEVLGSGTVATFKGTGGNAFIGIQDVDSGNSAFIGNEDGGLVFQTPSSSYSTKMTITHSGDVGIGITNPTNTLVLKETDPVLVFRRNFGSGTSDIGSINFGNNNIDSDLARITVEGDGATDNAAIVFKTQATGNAVTERLRIDSSGNVGIGTDDPINSLHLHSNTSGTGPILQLSNNTGDCRLFFGTHSTTADANAQGQIRYNVANNYLAAYTTGSERLRITSEGKVQIDRTVSSTSGNHPALEIETHCSGSEDTTFATGIDFKVDGVHKKRLAVTDGTGEGGGDWIFYRDNGTNEALRINSGGQVLVGTATNPAYTNRRFTVADSTASGTCAVEIRGSASGDSRLYFTSSTTSGQTGAYAGKVLYSHANNTMGFYVNGTIQALHIDSSGKVGIGSDVPTEKLDVGGTVKAAGVSITGNASGIEFKTASANSSNYIKFNDHSSSDDGRIQYEHSTDEFLFLTGTSWRARLHADYFKPETTNEVDLGVTGQRFKNLWLSGNATVTGTVAAADFNSTSDIRLKTNIQPIEDPLAKVIQIEGVSFNWKKDNKPALGVIADQVEEILPELVQNADPKTVNYNGLIGLLIEAVKEQQTQIDGLKERLSKLE